MADVFISYARPDASVARELAGVLTAAGYEVWWDSELLPHHAFAQAIENEVRSAKAVLVVWSTDAVNSQWVRAESDLARSQGKLVQIVIDESVPPLPFNQYQTADLRGWQGDGSNPQWKKVLASIAQLTAKPDGGAPTQAPHVDASRGIGRRRGRTFFLMTAAVGCFVIATLLGGVWLLHDGFGAPARRARIAVRPFEAIGQSPALRDFATSLSGSLHDALNQDQLQTLSSSDAETLQGPDLPAKLKALNVGLLLNGTVQAAADDLTVRMDLEDPLQHTTLWSADIPGKASQFEALQAQVGARTIAVLNCSAQALSQKGGLTDADVLALFLHACDLAETSDHGGNDDKLGFAMLEVMREVARRAPNFAAAHSILAKHAGFLMNSLPGQAAPLRAEAQREAHRALELNPKDPDAYVALGLIAPTLDFRQREHFYRQALAIDPSWPHANGFLGNVMTDLGRVEEASTLYQRAASVSPLSPDWSDMAAQGLIWAGQAQGAEEDVKRFSQLWPNESYNFRNQLLILIAQHKWAEALKYTNDAISQHANLAVPLGRRRVELTALTSHDPKAMEAAKQQELEIAKTNQPSAIIGLALLGFVDDAFAVAQQYSPIGPDDVDNPGFLFGPLAASLRRDPRFMKLANKFGLPQYWLSTGKWPDFCGEPDLPYNCKQETLKLKLISNP